MSKLPLVTVTFIASHKKPAKPLYLKATSINNARDVVIEKFGLAAFTSEQLENVKILHVYIFFKGKSHRVEPIDKVTSKLTVVAGRPTEHGKFRLKRKKPEKHKHNHSGLRHLIQDQDAAMVA